MEVDTLSEPAVQIAAAYCSQDAHLHACSAVFSNICGYETAAQQAQCQTAACADLLSRLVASQWWLLQRAGAAELNITKTTGNETSTTPCPHARLRVQTSLVQPMAVHIAAHCVKRVRSALLTLTRSALLPMSQ